MNVLNVHFGLVVAKSGPTLWSARNGHASRIYPHKPQKTHICHVAVQCFYHRSIHVYCLIFNQRYTVLNRRSGHRMHQCISNLRFLLTAHKRLLLIIRISAPLLHWQKFHKEQPGSVPTRTASRYVCDGYHRHIEFRPPNFECLPFNVKVLIEVSVRNHWHEYRARIRQEFRLPRPVC